MLFFKLTDGPEILIHDGVDESHSLWGISHWIYNSPEVAGLVRIERSLCRLIIRFDESVEYETAIRRASHAWRHYLSDYFGSDEFAAAIGIQGLPLEVPDSSGFVNEIAGDEMTEADWDAYRNAVSANG